MKIENAVALVTGANRGIGRSLVLALRAAGARRIYAAARSPESLAALVAEGGGRVVPLKLDVTDPRDVERAAREAPDVTLLVNNAGTLASFRALESPREQIDRDFATNVFGMLSTTAAFAPAIERAGGGAIVNLLSIVSLASMPGLGGYSASKAAALSLTQSFRGELRSKGIQVHAVFPGPVDTDMAKDIQMPKTSPDAVARAILEGVERGDEDILPDPMSRQVFAGWKSDPKAVERQFTTM